MELKPGYKRTEVGVMPEDWEVRRLDELAEIRSGGTPSTGEPSFWDGDIPWCTPTDITALNGHKYLRETSRLITTLGLNASSAEIIPAQSVAMTSRATIGECAINAVPISTNQGFKNFIPFVTTDVDFLYYLLGAQKQGLTALCGGSTFLEIGKTQLAAYKVRLPSTKAEQTAIATTLSDMDALLDGLDKLIAKRRDLRQATMQQLLTGKARLPGFSEDWGETRLGDVASFFKGKGLPKSAISESGAEPCIHYGELFTRHPETIGEIYSRTDSFAGAFRSVKNDVLMPTSDVTPRGLAKASCITSDDVILGGDILVIRADTALICGSFLSFLIRYEGAKILKLVTGSTVYHLYGSDMEGFAFSMPSLPEQTAIAAVLSDMNAELAALEVRRDKARNIKQAMMQELLTGKTRLV